MRLTIGVLALVIGILGVVRFERSKWLPTHGAERRLVPHHLGQLQGKLTLTGSSTVAPLAAEIAKRFERLHPNVRIDVQAGGSGKGIADVRAGHADIGMASRELDGHEKDLVVYPIAADGVCLIVHRSNPIAELTREQVVAIYTDKVNNWSQVGGPDLPITVVHKAEGRATLDVFLRYFQLRNPQVVPDVIVGHNEQGVKSVAGNRGALGYVSIGVAEADERNGIEIRRLPLDGIPATTDNVASGDFPLSRPLNLVTQSSPDALSRAFLEFAQSEQVHDLITKQYFVPIAW